MRRILASSILCLTIGLVAAGCGGSDQSASTTCGGTGRGGGRRRVPGGSGKVTDVSGSTAQVQGQTRRSR